jgi:hypothetical protein
MELERFNYTQQKLARRTGPHYRTINRIMKECYEVLFQRRLDPILPLIQPLFTGYPRLTQNPC